MSEENVELVRRCVAALDREDYEVARSCFEEEAEWNNTATFPGPRTVLGAGAIVEFWQDLSESFRRGSQGGTRIEDIRASEDRVVVALHTRGRGAASGAPIDVDYALTVSVRDGMIRRVDVSGDYSRALGAAGLSE
jgi:ketosteroid isomerase-like protein